MCVVCLQCLHSIAGAAPLLTPCLLCCTDGSPSGTELSSLDLISVDTWRLLLLLRPGKLANIWAQAVSTVVRMHKLLGTRAVL